MKWRVGPSQLSGEIVVPPSKSHSIRAALIATLADGTSVIRRPLLYGDGRSALNAAAALGAMLTEVGDTVTVTGLGGRLNGGAADIFTGNSGTTTTLFAGAATLGTKPRRFDGDSSLRSRPFSPLLEALSNLGARCRVLPEAQRDVPFEVCGPLCGGQTTVNGVSSQFVSSLLLSCPLAQRESTIIVHGLQERPYVELTLWWLRRTNILFDASPDFSRFVVPGCQIYSPIDLTIPADFSSATFAAVAAAITGSVVRLKGLDFSDPQGDKGVFNVLSDMGVEIVQTKDEVIVMGKPLHGITIDLNAMPDALPALAVAGCCAEGETRIVNVAHARIKECDRIGIMAALLRAMGGDVTEYPDGLLLRRCRLRGCSVFGHGDHRVVMALALAAMVAEGETIIDGAEAAEVTYPSFAADFQALGANIQIVEENLPNHRAE